LVCGLVEVRDEPRSRRDGPCFDHLIAWFRPESRHQGISHRHICREIVARDDENIP
jgi:hypothetical protein